MTCLNLGETEEGVACSQFKPSDKNLNKELAFDHQSLMLNTIVDLFEIHKASDIVLHSVANQLKQQGHTVEFQPKFFEYTVSSLVDMLTIHRLCIGLGLGMYEEEIMSHIIAAKFARRDTPVPQVKASGTQANLALTVEDLLQEIRSLKDTTLSGVKEK